MYISANAIAWCSMDSCSFSTITSSHPKWLTISMVYSYLQIILSSWATHDFSGSYCPLPSAIIETSVASSLENTKPSSGSARQQKLETEHRHSGRLKTFLMCQNRWGRMFAVNIQSLSKSQKGIQLLTVKLASDLKVFTKFSIRKISTCKIGKMRLLIGKLSRTLYFYRDLGATEGFFMAATWMVRHQAIHASMSGQITLNTMGMVDDGIELACDQP